MRMKNMETTLLCNQRVPCAPKHTWQKKAIQYKLKRRGKKRVGGKVGNHLDADTRTQNKGRNWLEGMEDRNSLGNLLLNQY